MTDKIFGQDFTNESNPLGSYTISVNNGTALVDVALSDLHKALSPFLAPGGLNYSLSPSVASNNLTLAIKGQNGNDPSTSNPVSFAIESTIYVLTSAVSFTKNAGTNWCNAGSAEMAAKAIDFFVYAIGETGAGAGLKFGFSRIPWATTMGDFVNTTTSEKYIAGNWTNFNGTDAVKVIGRFRAQLSASASFNWSIASAKVINYPIYETDWLSYTPQITAATGTYTSVTGSGTYKIGLYGMLLTIRVTITTNGTAATAAIATLPFTVVLQASYGNGRENASTGTPLFARNETTTAIYITKYDGTYLGANGYVLDIFSTQKLT